MSSGSGPPTGLNAFGTAITGGVQDISALLPLLGTEQCETHLASALTGGYLYAAATPMSIFGALGAAKTGFKAWLASINLGGKIGAQIAKDAGFDSKGSNLSQILIKENEHRHSSESKLVETLEKLRIEDARNLTIAYNCTWWNTKLFLSTAMFSLVGFTP